MRRPALAAEVALSGVSAGAGFTKGQRRRQDGRVV